MKDYPRYRIVTDAFSGFEVQVKLAWWLPFWMECARNGFWTNTHRTIELARAFAATKPGVTRIPPPKRKTVEYL